LADATDQRWDEFTLLEAALIASGAEQAGELHACTKAMRAHAARLAGEAAHDASPRDRAISVQRYLHREVLLGPYDANCNDLRRRVDSLAGNRGALAGACAVPFA
jgi:hypothetical protein